jgi:tetratricopeptide (TPR) repeat protein
LAISHEIGDRAKAANALYNLGAYYLRLGQNERAIEYDQQALAIYRELGDHNPEANTLKNIAVAYVNLKQLEKAVEFTQAAVQVFEKTGGPGADSAWEQLVYLQKLATKKWWQFWL